MFIFNEFIFVIYTFFDMLRNNIKLIKKFKFKVYLGKVLINKYDLYNLKYLILLKFDMKLYIIRIKIVKFL